MAQDHLLTVCGLCHHHCMEMKSGFKTNYLHGKYYRIALIEKKRMCSNNSDVTELCRLSTDSIGT